MLVRPDVYVATMSERRGIAESIGGLLAAFTGEHVGEPRLLICLYGPPLVHVDLKFVTLEDMRSLVERPRLQWAREPSKVQECLDVADVAWPNRSPQWFEDRAWELRQVDPPPATTSCMPEALRDYIKATSSI